MTIITGWIIATSNSVFFDNSSYLPFSLNSGKLPRILFESQESSKIFNRLYQSWWFITIGGAIQKFY
jgi:hypothetical protein